MSAILRDLRAAFGDVEPVPYNVVVQRAGYEERVYPGRRWACTTMQGHSRDALVTPMFRRLFCYISGRNEPNIRIDMTTPVLTLVKPTTSQHKEEKEQENTDQGKENTQTNEEEINHSNGTLPSSSSSSSPSSSSSSSCFTYTMGFLIPASHQEKPPASSDQNIFIEDRPDMTVFVRRFSGFMNDSIVEREKQVLFKCIRENGEDEGVDFTQYYVAQFDPPFKLLGRRNEVWVRKLLQKGVSGLGGDGGGSLLVNGNEEKEEEEEEEEVNGRKKEEEEEQEKEEEFVKSDS